MPTIPTGQMERELRAIYLRWIAEVSYDSKNLTDKLSAFEKTSQDLIERLGGQVASLGALADFPVPKRLDLSPHVGTIYSDMQQAAIQAGIMAGLNSTDVARQMFNAGMDKSFNRLNRLARTETVSAYWKNAWDSISDLPLLVMVWGSEDGPRTCEWCRERDGLVMDSPDLRDHPNGRCTPIPTLRSQVKYRGSVSRDGSIYYDADWDKANTQSTTTKNDVVDITDPTAIRQVDSMFNTWMETNEVEGSGDYMLRHVYKYTGYDTTLPELVDEIPGGAVKFYRGLSSDGINAADARQAFLEGEHFAGRGIFGNGSYFGNELETAQVYAKGSGQIIEAAWKPGAKILEIDGSSLQAVKDRIQELLKLNGGYSDGFSDLGSAASLLGYDGIHVVGVTEHTGDYQIVLNRAALWVKR